MPARMSASRSARACCRCSIPPPAAQSAPRCTRGKPAPGDLMADVALERVTRQFDTVTAVSDLSLSVLNGEFVVLLGPTGAGKTTTLRLVAGLEQPDVGTVSIK